MQRLHKITLAATAAVALSITGAVAKSRAISTDGPSVILNGNQTITEPAGSHVMAMYIWSRTYALQDLSEGLPESSPPSDQDRVVLADFSVDPIGQTTLFCNPADGDAGHCTTSVFGQVADLGISNGTPLQLGLVTDNLANDFIVGTPIALGTPGPGGFLDWVPKTGGYATFDFANEEDQVPGSTGLAPPSNADVMAALALHPGGANAKFVGFQDWFYNGDEVAEYQYDAAVIAVWTVANVPEPATWAMLLVGLFGLGSAVRYASRKGQLPFAA
jgi:PEP-CTERM motif-containing protein